MKHTLHVLAIGALGFGLAACGGSGSSGQTLPGSGSGGSATGANTTQYKQIELLSRPAVKELFEKFIDHQTTNAAEPYADTTLQTEIQGFTDALRPPSATLGSDYGKALAGVLYPNWITVDVSQTGGAAYLGNETGGATSATHSTFGGRALTDDVVDNEEDNCLITDNVAMGASQAPVATFPYLHAPH